MNFGNAMTIFRKEMSSYFNSAMAYVLIVVFLGLVGWFYGNQIFLINAATLRPLFDIVPWIFLFLIPAITMRLISEERHSGTLELLTTKPVTDIEILTGKFLAAWSLIAVAMLPTFLYWIAIGMLGELDSGPVIGGYIGSMLLAALYISLGLLASSLTANQVVAFILGLIFMFSIFMLDKTLIFLPSWMSTTMEFVGVDYHYQNIARGVIDTRNIIYFASAIGLAFYLTLVSLDRRKW